MRRIGKTPDAQRELGIGPDGLIPQPLGAVDVSSLCVGATVGQAILRYFFIPALVLSLVLFCLLLALPT